MLSTNEACCRGGGRGGDGGCGGGGGGGGGGEVMWGWCRGRWGLVGDFYRIDFFVFSRKYSERVVD